MAWIAPVASAAVGAGSALLSGGDKEASTSSSVTPALWDSLGGGANDLWAEFMGSVKGGVPGAVNYVAKEQSLLDAWERGNPGKFRALSAIDRQINSKQAEYEAALRGEPYAPVSGIPGLPVEPKTAEQLGQELNTLALEKERQFPELAGMYSKTYTAENVAKATPSLKERMAEDAAAQKDAATKYLEEMGVLTSDTTSGLKGAMDEYKTQASTPAFNLLVGNKKVPIQTNRQMKLADSLYDKGSSNLEKLFELNSGQKGRELNVATEYTPNKSTIEYFDKLWPIIQSFQNNRFGATSTTQNASIPTSAAERINTGIKTGSSVYDLIKSMNLGED